MKKLLTASLPALALLALGGCTAARSVATTEDDGVYYSSRDRTTAVAQAAPASRQRQSEAATAPTPADNGEATNPDYQGSANTQRPTANSPEYYDEGYANSSSSYDSRFRQPYAGPNVGLAYYSPPVVFAPSYGYGGGYSPYGGAFCDPFYSPVYASPLYGAFYSPYSSFYDPFGYGYGGYGGSFFSLSFGFGRPWGGYGYGYSRPYYGGYGGYGYDPYYGGGGYYGNGYGSYGGGYYGSSRQIIRPGSSNSVGVGNPVLVGPRRGRGGDVLAGRGTTPAPTGTMPGATSPGGGRRSGIVGSPTAPIGGVVALPNPGSPAPAITGNGDGSGNYGRRRMSSGDAALPTPNSPTTISDHDQATGNANATTGGRFNERGNQRLGNPEIPTPSTSAEPGREGRRGGWRRLDEGSGATTGTNNGAGAGRGFEQPQQPEAQPQPEQRQARRRGFFDNAPNTGQSQAGNGNSRGYEQPVPQPQPQRTYEQPQRTYERPQRAAEQQPTYSQPQRSYERPSQPSYSAPSYGGGGGGGGRRGGRM